MLQFQNTNEFLDFIELYKDAVTYNQKTFQYKGNVLLTGFAKYVIEYIKGRLELSDVDIDTLLKHRASAREQTQ